MNKTIFNPSKYIRKLNGLTNIGQHVVAFGSTVVLIGGNTAIAITKATISKSLIEHGINLIDTYWYGGECSQTKIDRLIEYIEQDQPEVIIVVGGGKAIDTTKAVAYKTKLPLVVVPTIASTCAATTPVSILYDDDGAFIKTNTDSKAADLVLVDNNIIGQAPNRFLSAGIGDTIAKWFEFNQSIKKLEYTAVNRTALAVAKEIYSILIEDGVLSLEKLGHKHAVALDNVVDSLVLLGGMVSSYSDYDSPTAAAHAIYSGLTIFPESHQAYHGEIVAFGILAQMMMENRSEEEVRELINFYKKVNLPYTLETLGVPVLSKEQWQQFGEYTVDVEDMEYMPFKVSPQMVISAVKRADQIGREVIRE